MLKALKALIGGNDAAQRTPAGEFEQRQLRSAVAVLLADAERADLEVKPDEIRVSHRALIDLLGVNEAQAMCGYSA